MRCGVIATGLWLLTNLTIGFAAEGKLSAVDKLPAGLSDAVAAAVSPMGQQATADGTPICTVWLAKELGVKADFKPSLNVKYPFAPGQLIGVIEVLKPSEFTDFRGQEVAKGVYTLRYAQQPVDGNHVGTSELYDFLLAVPAKVDTTPLPFKVLDELNKKSASTAGANHPAIYSLLPVDGSPTAAALQHDESKEFWILTLIGKATGGKSIPVRMVVVGKSEG